MSEETKVAEVGQPSPKKPRKKLYIVVGVVAAVVAVAGAGFWVWHETPGFCGAICHTPMDAYYQTYAEGAADKYGNALDEQGRASMMVAAHADEGYGCLDCHTPTLGQQIGEGFAWITGGYEIAGTTEAGAAYLATRSMDDLMAATDSQGYEMCLTPECHDYGLSDLESLTAGLSEERNPHAAQHDSIPQCGECHQAHSQSVNACTKCHSDAPVPDGWLTVAEANTIKS